MINQVRHLTHRKYITEVAEGLVTRKIDYEEGLHIINMTYQKFHKWTSHSNEEVINKISKLKRSYKKEIKEYSKFHNNHPALEGGATKEDRIIYDIFKEDVSDIVLSDLVQLAFCGAANFDYELINKEKYNGEKLLDQAYSLTTYKSYGTEMDYGGLLSITSALNGYKNWIENKKTGPYSYTTRHKYFKIDRALAIERRSN